jgi:hypothetical protein
LRVKNTVARHRNNEETPTADGAATLEALGQRTARQSAKKLEIMGLQPRFADEVRQLWDSRTFIAKAGSSSLAGPAAMVKISESLRKHMMPEFKAAAGRLKTHHVWQLGAAKRWQILFLRSFAEFCGTQIQSRSQYWTAGRAVGIHDFSAMKKERSITVA